MSKFDYVDPWNGMKELPGDLERMAREDWQEFECPECGHVEQIDVAALIPNLTLACKICGEPLEKSE